VLSLGALVGAPMLVPLLLHAASAALIFVLARRLANGGIALLTWMLWLSSPSVLLFGPRYYSETVTTACWLASFLALLEWRARGKRRWLLALAFLVGWGAITRPLTMLLFAIPVGIVVIELVRRRGAWRDLALAAALGASVLAIIPVWSAATTGNWRVTPLSVYMRQYTPWDLPGFGYNRTPPERALTPDLNRLRLVLGAEHAAHTVDALPSIFLIRLRAIRDAVWGGPRKILIPFAVIGLATVGAEVGVALAAGICLIVGYLSFPMAAGWTLYYYETFPVFAFLTASGLALAAAAVARLGAPLRSQGWRAPRLANLAAIGALAFLPTTFVLMRVVRRLQHIQHMPQQAFADRLAAIPDARAVVFVRYKPDHDPHVSLVRNSADPARERIWVAYDRGPAENAQLLAHAAGRTAYLFDEAGATMRPYAGLYATH
jgi:4-amino-4-deoxy-L-arabinose transferase-like glycosyltransferase